MKKIVDSYDKALLAGLPRAVFKGKIHVIISQSEAERAVSYLLRQPLIGLDTETRPSFRAGQNHKVALLQASTDDVCFLFRLCRIGLPPCLIALLEDTRVTKAALSWHDDLRGLHQLQPFQAGTFVELQDEAARMGIRDMSLQKLFANLFSQKISKGQQLSNWEADSLSEAQQLYAATDAWACVRLYSEMTRLRRDGFELIKTQQDEPNHTSQG